MPSQDALAMPTSSDQKERTRPEARKSVSPFYRMTFREVNESGHFNVIGFVDFGHLLQDVLSQNEENGKIAIQDEVTSRLTQISMLVNQNVLVFRNGLVGNTAVAVIIANNM